MERTTKGEKEKEKEKEKGKEEEKWRNPPQLLSDPSLLQFFSQVIGGLILSFYPWAPPPYDCLSKIIPLLVKNLSIYLLFYGLPYLTLYVSSVGRKAFTHLKFTPQFPKDTLIRREMIRTMTSCLIGTFYDLLIWYCLTSSTSLATSLSSSSSQIPTTNENNNSNHDNHNISFYEPLLGPNAISTLVILVFVLAILDLHFFCVHRMLHLPWLYKHIHSVHHQSYNPNPWSGLSFHPVEALLYFSSLLIFLVFPFPVHRFHVIVAKFILDVNPVFGHLGYGGWLGGSYFHFLHHTRKSYNYGGTPLWDKIFGTYTE
jgi:sterol desaturase/sphingolipid hydroxylase (fatty acid hydroxylase superfamily)